MFLLRLILPFLILVNCDSAFSNTHFERGLNAVKEQKFSEAVESFQKAAVEQPKNLEIFYNLSLALNLNRQPAESLALILSLRKTDPQNSLYSQTETFLRSQLPGASLKELSAAEYALRIVTSSVSLEQMAFLIIIVLVIFFRQVILFLSARRKAKIIDSEPPRFGVLFYLNLTLGLALGFLCVYLYVDNLTPKGVIVANVSMKSSPSESSPSLDSIPQGASVRLLRAKDNWLLVEDHNGLSGWILNETLAKIQRL
jgi:hypothetical protein